MTSLARELSSSFAAAVRRRGVDYYEGDRVQIETGSEMRLAAVVRGTEDYTVELQRERDEIRASCTCPHFDQEVCKHIWACILAADARRLLQGDGRGGPVYLAYDDFGDDDLDFDEGVLRTRRSDTGGPPQSQLAAGWSKARSAGESNKPANWRTAIERIRLTEPPSPPITDWPATRELFYVVDASATLAGRGLGVELWSHDEKKDGTRGKPKLRAIPRRTLDSLPNADDRYILAFLAGATELYGAYSYHLSGADDYGSYPARYRLTDPQPGFILPVLCRTRRCRLKLRTDDDETAWLVLNWDDGEPWQFGLEVTRDVNDGDYRLSGFLRRGAERMPLATPALLTSGGILVAHDYATRFNAGGAFAWVSLLRERQSLAVPAADSEAFVAELFEQPGLPPLELPDELRLEEVSGTPRPRLTVRPAPFQGSRTRVFGEVEFDYGGSIVASEPATRGIIQSATRRLLLRDAALEKAAAEQLVQLGWRRATGLYLPARQPTPFEISSQRLPNAIRELARSGWHIEAEGRVFRPAGSFHMEVTSGIDWFELHGRLEFGDGVGTSLPELLAAVRRGEDSVLLADGSLGLIPEEWAKQYGLLTGLGAAQKDHVRFERHQVALLDALLTVRPEIASDERFERARRALSEFSGIEPAEAPNGFRGELRQYQKEGLGWLRFLQRFGFGGCLADDMGLGKTVQVLALLEGQREARVRNGGPHRPSLVVVPQSLVFNWQQRGGPLRAELRVLDYTGHERAAHSERSFADFDVVLTTYGTLRRDVIDLKDLRVRLRRPRRSAGDQERQHRYRPRPCACCAANIAWR